MKELIIDDFYADVIKLADEAKGKKDNKDKKGKDNGNKSSR